MRDSFQWPRRGERCSQPPPYSPLGLISDALRFRCRSGNL